MRKDRLRHPRYSGSEDAELHFIEIERVLKGFMEAETIEERAKYVRHPERVLPLMRDFYSRNEFQSRVYRGIRAYQNVPLDGLPFIAIEVKDSVGNFHPLLIEDGEEGVLIDWESHECFQPVSIEDYVRDRPTDPVSLRVYVSDDYFHSYEFQDKTEYASYRLKFRESDAVLNGYVKRGTELDQKFRKLYPESHKGQWRPLILKVRFLEGGEARNSVLIEELQSQVWAYLRNPAEVASMGIIFVPFLAGVMILFYDAEKKWAWWLSGLGLAVICVEILSRVRFVLNMKTTSLLLVLGMVAAGAGLLARSYVLGSRKADEPAEDSDQKNS